MADIEGMRGREIDYIPDRLISDPIVFRGMTDTEVVTSMVIGLFVWTPTSILILLPFGYGLFGVALGVGLAILSLILVGRHLTMIKRKQPDGLHVVHFKKLLQRKGLARFGYIDESASWDMRRSAPVQRFYVETLEDDD